MRSDRLPHNPQQRADELRREAHHAHVDGRSRRSAELNRAAAVLENRYADMRAQLRRLDDGKT